MPIRRYCSASFTSGFKFLDHTFETILSMAIGSMSHICCDSIIAAQTHSMQILVHTHTFFQSVMIAKGALLSLHIFQKRPPNQDAKHVNKGSDYPSSRTGRLY